MQPRVHTVVLQQFGMTALLRNHAVMEHEDHVRESKTATRSRKRGEIADGRHATLPFGSHALSTKLGE